MAGSHKLFNDAILHWVDQERVVPGECARAYLRPIEARFWNSVKVGDKIELWEGLSILVGHATVLSI